MLIRSTFNVDIAAQIKAVSFLGSKMVDIAYSITSGSCTSQFEEFHLATNVIVHSLFSILFCFLFSVFLLR